MHKTPAKTVSPVLPQHTPHSGAKRARTLTESQLYPACRLLVTVDTGAIDTKTSMNNT